MQLHVYDSESPDARCLNVIKYQGVKGVNLVTCFVTRLMTC